jgi:hypothetical protein
MNNLKDSCYNTKKISEEAIKNMSQEEIGPSFENVLNYCFDTFRKVINSKRFEELEERFGYNGKRGCDTADGPCSCGAWHHLSDLVSDDNIKIRNFN